MAVTIKHAKTDNIADWTQADLDAQIALGNYPAGTVLADIVLPSDWNNDHTISGTVPVANGGTGQSSYTDGQLLIGNSTGNTLSKATLTAGSNITITNGAGAITIASTGGGGMTYPGAGIANSTGSAWGTSYGTTGANSVVVRDANQNITINSSFNGFTSVAASGTQITLTAASTPVYLITGSGGQTIKLPDATTLPNGVIFSFNNNQSSGAITVNNNSNTLIVSVPSGGYTTVVLLSNATAAGSWDRHDQTPANVSWSTNTFDYAGSITSATWNGNVIALNRGGTNANLTAVNGGAVYSTGTALAISAAGTSGQVLTSSGAGAPTWTTPTTGTVTSVTGTSPVVSSGGATPAISMPAATTSVSGYLTSTDWNTFNGKGSGTVTSASVVSANGFAGTVANATTTPAITLTTSITGVLKGNGTAISAAVSGTDYAPATSGSSILYGNGSGGFSNVTVGSGLAFTAGTLSASGGGGMTYPTGSGIAVVVSGTSWGTTLTAPSGTIVGTTDTQTLTNKRVTPRVSTTTSSATPTINTDNVDTYGLTAQAVDITSFTTNLSGTPTDGQRLHIYIVGTAARAITWGASFENSTVTLPSTTVTTNRLDIGFIWNAATSKWRCVASA